MVTAKVFFLFHGNMFVFISPNATTLLNKCSFFFAIFGDNSVVVFYVPNMFWKVSTNMFF
jgi:hypothetical protein